jgi:hypothetical protein
MGLSQEFEAFARSVLACGCSGRQARNTILLTVGFLLPAALAVPLCDEMPLVRWFVTQREALGIEAAVYAFMAVGELFRCLVPYLSKLTTLPAPSGACDEVVQWGFDETTLDGTACFNQWCLLRTGTRFVLTLTFSFLSCFPGVHFLTVQALVSLIVSTKFIEAFPVPCKWNASSWRKGYQGRNSVNG